MADTARRILVVDDNLEGAEVLSILLEHFGHEVRTAGGGLEALQVASEFRPHVVFLDIDLPDVDGYETCRRLRGRPGGDGVFIAALTGWERPEDQARALEAGFDVHLVKPVGPDAIRSLLDGLSPPDG